MNNKFLYTDGLRVDQINGILNNIKNTKYFFENDLSKQDRQTD